MCGPCKYWHPCSLTSHYLCLTTLQHFLCWIAAVFIWWHNYIPTPARICSRPPPWTRSRLRWLTITCVTRFMKGLPMYISMYSSYQMPASLPNQWFLVGFVCFFLSSVCCFLKFCLADGIHSISGSLTFSVHLCIDAVTWHLWE